jgi:GTPase
MKSSESAVVEFRFIRNPEFIRTGSRILFREGRTKGIGLVTMTDPFEPVSFER